MVSGGGVLDFLAIIRNSFLGVAYFAKNPEFGQGRFWDRYLDRDSAPEGYKGQVAADYPDCLQIIESRVKPERTRLKPNGEYALRKPLPQKWWIYGDKRPALYSTIAGMKRVLTVAATSRTLAFVFSPVDLVFSHATYVFAFSEGCYFAVLQSAFHEAWARKYASSLKDDLRYTPTDCFETFPFPANVAMLNGIGDAYHDHRRRIMVARQDGLTKTYNRYHDPEETDDDIQKLRQLHVEMDKAVATAYGWPDLDLGHDHHPTKQGIRFTISEAARREVLGRLLKLNHERYAEQVKQGLHEKGRGKRGQSRGRKKVQQPEGKSLYDNEEDDDPAEETEGENDAQAVERPAPIEAIETDDVMAAFRQAARGRGLMERPELLKLVSVALGYQRLGPKIEEALRGHLRAAIRRKIIEADGQHMVRPGTTTMEDYGLDELREFVASVMRKGPRYDREDVITAVARTLGFARVTDTSRDAIKSAINSAIRQGILGYEGSVIWRSE